MRGTEAGLFRNRYLQVLALVLLLQVGLFYSASRGEKVPSVLSLYYFPLDIQNWKTQRDMPVEPEVQEILKADDTLNRLYQNTETGEGVYLFVAFFKSQRTGQTPHSPRNCLPGSGWEPVKTGYVPVSIPGRAQPIQINRYVVQRGNDQSLVLYWYQSRNRVVANEFAAKFWLVADSIRYHRSDTSLVRVLVPMRGNDLDAATRTGTAFVASVFPLLRQYLGK